MFLVAALSARGLPTRIRQGRQKVAMKPHVPYRIVGVIRVDRTESIAWRQVVGRISPARKDVPSRNPARPATESTLHADQRLLKRQLRQMLQTVTGNAP